MDKVPVMISTKDLSYLHDIFEWNFNASKQANHFSEEITDEEIKNEIHNIALMHKTICENIITILE